jgi:hypothetical protein
VTNVAIPTTETPEWGFFGTMARQAAAGPTEAAWNAALTAIVAATGCTHGDARVFLDSRFGRHFADDVRGYLLANQSIPAAIQSAVTRWMGGTITRETSLATRFPSGLPYLRGFVMHATIEAENQPASGAGSSGAAG